MESCLFKTLFNYVHTYFIRYFAAEYAIQNPDGNLSPPHVHVVWFPDPSCMGGAREGSEVWLCETLLREEWYSPPLLHGVNNV